MKLWTHDRTALHQKVEEWRRYVTIALVLFLVCISTLLAFRFTGSVVVFDRSHSIKKAYVTNDSREHILYSLPFGLFASIPTIEGETVVESDGGEKLSGFYITPHWHTWVEVLGESRCLSMRIVN